MLSMICGALPLSEERHGVEVVRSLRHAHMAHVLRVAANLESQAVFGADEILSAGHGDEVGAAKLLKNDLRYSEIGHFFLCFRWSNDMPDPGFGGCNDDHEMADFQPKNARPGLGPAGGVDGTGTEFVRLNVDVIVTGGNVAVAVKHATSVAEIVFPLRERD
jgi:hypothetical protein